MKNLKKSLQSVTKELKALTRKAEGLAKSVGSAKKAKTKAAAKGKVKSRAKAKTKATKRAKVKTKKKAASKAPARKKAVGMTATDKVLRIIKQSKDGVDAPTLIKKTRLQDKQIRNILFRASKQKKIKRAGRGVYVAA